MRDTIHRRLLAGETPENIAAALGLATSTDHDEAGVAVVLPGWYADDGDAEVEFPDADSAEDAAQQYVSDGDWGETKETSWVRVRTWRAGLLLIDGEVVEVVCDEDLHTVEIEPTEPDCTSDEHDWQSPYKLVGGIRENPGCWGHGGGVIYHEVCLRCGCCRTTDTWAQDRSTGAQGLRSVAYAQPVDDHWPDDVVTIDDYLSGLERRDLSYRETIDEGEGTDGYPVLVEIAESPLECGRWAVLVAAGEYGDEQQPEWYDSEAAARAAAARKVDDLI